MKPKLKNPITLARWIWRSYLKTALLPIILLELVFLGIFFGINLVMKGQLSVLVTTAADKQISKMVSLEAASIDCQLTNVGISTRSFAAQMRKALQTPEPFRPEDLNRLDYTPDGAYYTTADNGGAAVFYSGIVPIHAAERDKVARVLAMQGMMKDIHDTNPLISSLYLNTYDSLNVIYPYINVIDQYAPKIDVTTFNFYYEADAAHNPAKTEHWTNVYLDPAGNGWLASLIAPVYNGDVLEGVVGIDVAVENIINEIMTLEIPERGYCLLVGNDGTILALTDKGKEDWKLTDFPGYDNLAVKQDAFIPDTYNLFKMPGITNFAEELSENPSGISTWKVGDGNKRVSWATIKETGWKLVLFVPEKSIMGTINRVGASLQEVGIILTVGMILFFAGFFRTLVVRSKKMSESLSEPLVALDNMTMRIGAGNYYQEVPEFGVKELQETSTNVVKMGYRLGEINSNLLSVQAELKEKETYLQAVINCIDDAVIELDENGIITNLIINEDKDNPAGLHRFSSIDSIFEKGRAELIIERLKNVIDSGRQETIETEVEFPTGTRWAQARMSLISREPARVVVTARDITERKEMEASIIKAKEDAEAANRAKSQFLSNMSHELRTPLNAVLGFAQVLEMDPSIPLTGMQKECVYEIMKAGNHLLELITEVLDLARIEAGKTSLSIEPVDINIVIEETMTIIMPTAEKYGIKVDAEPGNCGHRYVQADKTKLKQILINLLSNAIKYNKPKGKVDYYCEIDDGKVRLHVVDTGIGIPEEELEAIFKPFHRLSKMKNVVEGTGVGLAVVKQLAEMMGGFVHAESTEGEGSHFFIELPAAEEMTLWSERTDLPSKTVAADISNASYKKVLYIEDNQANLRLVERILELIPGTKFLSAQTAELGLETARREKPDVILMDINLPGMDGYEAFEKLQGYEETKSIPVIAVTSNAMEKKIERAVKMGFFDYITKPIKTDVFFDRIKRVFGARP